MVNLDDLAATLATGEPVFVWHVHQEPRIRGQVLRIADGQVAVRWENQHITFSEPSSLELA